jgi:hypothetical protein
MSTNTAAITATFKVGTTYDTGRGDYRWSFVVVARTAKRMLIRDVLTGESRLVGITVSDFNGPREIAFPLGKFSMAPVIDAARPA